MFTSATRPERGYDPESGVNPPQTIGHVRDRSRGQLHHRSPMLSTSMAALRTIGRRVEPLKFNFYVARPKSKAYAYGGPPHKRHGVVLRLGLDWRRRIRAGAANLHVYVADMRFAPVWTRQRIRMVVIGIHDVSASANG